MQMDKTSIIADAISYIHSLQKTMKETEADSVSAYQPNTSQYSITSTNQFISSSRIDSSEMGSYEKGPTKSQTRQGFKILEVSLYNFPVI